MGNELEIEAVKVAGISQIPGDNIKTLPITLDGTYISTSAHPSFAVLDFRALIGSLSNYFKTGTELWCILEAAVDTGSGTGRFYLKDDKNGLVFGLFDLDIQNITFQSGNTIRITLPASTDLSKVYVGEFLRIDGATNASNNGQHEILVVNDASDYLDVLIPGRSDNTDDETTSPGIGETGSVTQFTNTSDEIISSKPFRITENIWTRPRLNKSTGSGSNVYSYQLLLFTK